MSRDLKEMRELVIRVSEEKAFKAEDIFQRDEIEGID